MRLLRLDFGDELRRLDLHPLVTVIDDLSSDQQQQLFTAVRELARGTARSFRGLVEHRGALIDVQHPGDLTINEQRRCAYDVVLHLDDHLDAGEPVGLEVEIEKCRRQAEVDAVRLEELRADLKPSLWADVVLLRSRIEWDGRESAVPDSARWVSAPASSLPGTSSPVAISRSSSVEPTDDGAGFGPEADRLEVVVAAIDRVDSQPRYVEGFSPEIEELLSRWSKFVEVREGHGEHLSVLEQQLDEARERVRRAEHGLEQAEEAAKPVLLSNTEEARLETLAERAESTGGGWRRKSSGLSPEEKQELDDLMAKVGVRSWTEYSMFRLAPEVAPEREEAIDQARLELSESETRLHEAELAVGADPVAMELEAEYSRLRSEATTYLGAVVPNDVGVGLRELVERLDNPKWLEAVHELDQLLHGQGVTEILLAQDDPDQLVEWARIWVDYERSQLASGPSPDAAVDVTSAGTDTASAASAPPTEPEDLETMRRTLDEVERKLVRHRRALNRIRVVGARAAASNERLDHLRRLADRVRGPHSVTANEVADSVSPVIHQIRSDLGYAVPIVMSGSLPHLSSSEILRFIENVEDLAGYVQIIMVVSRSEAVDWALRAGPTRALHATGSARSLWSTLP